MQRKKAPILHALLALFAPFRGDWRAAQRGTTSTSASPLLTFIATVLFLILSIVEIDLHRDELRTFGLVGGEEPINPALMGP